MANKNKGAKDFGVKQQSGSFPGPKGMAGGMCVCVCVSLLRGFPTLDFLPA